MTLQIISGAVNVHETVSATVTLQIIGATVDVEETASADSRNTVRYISDE